MMYSLFVKSEDNTRGSSNLVVLWSSPFLIFLKQMNFVIGLLMRKNYCARNDDINGKFKKVLVNTVAIRNGRR